MHSLIDGSYVGPSNWSSILTDVIQAPHSTLTTIFMSTWGQDADFTIYKNLMDAFGTGSDSMLFQSFQVRKFTANGGHQKVRKVYWDLHI